MATRWAVEDEQESRLALLAGDADTARWRHEQAVNRIETVRRWYE